jgi:hypothetical protein
MLRRSEEEEVSEALSWTDWPARRQPGRAVLTAGIVVLTIGSVATVDRWLAFLGGILLLSSVGEWLLPTRFELDAEGVRVRGLLRSANRPWDRLGEWRAVPGGFWLPGRSRSRLLRRMRGVLLRCPEREDEVVAMLNEHLDRSEARATHV